MTTPHEELRERVARAMAVADDWDFETQQFISVEEQRQDYYDMADAAIALVIEAAAGVAEQKARDFLSPEYATNQPLSSIQERFACGQIASGIRALMKNEPTR